MISGTGKLLDLRRQSHRVTQAGFCCHLLRLFQKVVSPLSALPPASSHIWISHTRSLLISGLPYFHFSFCCMSKSLPKLSLEERQPVFPCENSPTPNGKRECEIPSSKEDMRMATVDSLQMGMRALSPRSRALQPVSYTRRKNPLGPTMYSWSAGQVLGEEKHGIQRHTALVSPNSGPHRCSCFNCGILNRVKASKQERHLQEGGANRFREKYEGEDKKHSVHV